MSLQEEDLRMVRQEGSSRASLMSSSSSSASSSSTSMGEFGSAATKSKEWSVMTMVGLAVGFFVIAGLFFWIGYETGKPSVTVLGPLIQIPTPPSSTTATTTATATTSSSSTSTGSSTTGTGTGTETVQPNINAYFEVRTEFTDLDVEADTFVNDNLVLWINDPTKTVEFYLDDQKVPLPSVTDPSSVQDVRYVLLIPHGEDQSAVQQQQYRKVEFKVLEEPTLPSFIVKVDKTAPVPALFTGASGSMAVAAGSTVRRLEMKVSAEEARNNLTVRVDGSVVQGVAFQDGKCVLDPAVTSGLIGARTIRIMDEAGNQHSFDMTFDITAPLIQARGQRTGRVFNLASLFSTSPSIVTCNEAVSLIPLEPGLKLSTAYSASALPTDVGLGNEFDFRFPFVLSDDGFHIFRVKDSAGNLVQDPSAGATQTYGRLMIDTVPPRVYVEEVAYERNANGEAIVLEVVNNDLPDTAVIYEPHAARIRFGTDTGSALPLQVELYHPADNALPTEAELKSISELITTVNSYRVEVKDLAGNKTTRFLTIAEPRTARVYRMSDTALKRQLGDQDVLNEGFVMEVPASVPESRVEVKRDTAPLNLAEYKQPTSDQTLRGVYHFTVDGAYAISIPDPVSPAQNRVLNVVIDTAAPEVQFVGRTSLNQPIQLEASQTYQLGYPVTMTAQEPFLRAKLFALQSQFFTLASQDPFVLSHTLQPYVVTVRDLAGNSVTYSFSVNDVFRYIQILDFGTGEPIDLSASTTCRAIRIVKAPYAPPNVSLVIRNIAMNASGMSTNVYTYSTSQADDLLLDQFGLYRLEIAIGSSLSAPAVYQQTGLIEVNDTTPYVQISSIVNGTVYNPTNAIERAKFHVATLPDGSAQQQQQQPFPETVPMLARAQVRSFYGGNLEQWNPTDSTWTDLQDTIVDFNTPGMYYFRCAQTINALTSYSPIAAVRIQDGLTLTFNTTTIGPEPYVSIPATDQLIVRLMEMYPGSGVPLSKWRIDRSEDATPTNAVLELDSAGFATSLPAPVVEARHRFTVTSTEVKTSGAEWMPIDQREFVVDRTPVAPLYAAFVASSSTSSWSSVSFAPTSPSVITLQNNGTLTVNPGVASADTVLLEYPAQTNGSAVFASFGSDSEFTWTAGRPIVLSYKAAEDPVSLAYGYYVFDSRSGTGSIEPIGMIPLQLQGESFVPVAFQVRDEASNVSHFALQYKFDLYRLYYSDRANSTTYVEYPMAAYVESSADMNTKLRSTYQTKLTLDVQIRPISTRVVVEKLVDNAPSTLVRTVDVSAGATNVSPILFDEDGTYAVKMYDLIQSTGSVSSTPFKTIYVRVDRQLDLQLEFKERGSSAPFQAVDTTLALPSGPLRVLYSSSDVKLTNKEPHLYLTIRHTNLSSSASNQLPEVVHVLAPDESYTIPRPSNMGDNFRVDLSVAQNSNGTEPAIKDLLESTEYRFSYTLYFDTSVRAAIRLLDSNEASSQTLLGTTYGMDPLSGKRFHEFIGIYPEASENQNLMVFVNNEQVSRPFLSQWNRFEIRGNGSYSVRIVDQAGNQVTYNNVVIDTARRRVFLKTASNQLVAYPSAPSSGSNPAPTITYSNQVLILRNNDIADPIYQVQYDVLGPNASSGQYTEQLATGTLAGQSEVSLDSALSASLTPLMAKPFLVRVTDANPASSPDSPRTPVEFVVWYRNAIPVVLYENQDALSAWVDGTTTVPGTGVYDSGQVVYQADKSGARIRIADYGVRALTDASTLRVQLVSNDPVTGQAIRVLPRSSAEHASMVDANQVVWQAFDLFDVQRDGAYTLHVRDVFGNTFLLSFVWMQKPVLTCQVPGAADQSTLNVYRSMSNGTLRTAEHLFEDLKVEYTEEGTQEPTQWAPALLIRRRVELFAGDDDGDQSSDASEIKYAFRVRNTLAPTIPEVPYVTFNTEEPIPIVWENGRTYLISVMKSIQVNGVLRRRYAHFVIGTNFDVSLNVAVEQLQAPDNNTIVGIPVTSDNFVLISKTGVPQVTFTEMDTRRVVVNGVSLVQGSGQLIVSPIPSSVFSNEGRYTIQVTNVFDQVAQRTLVVVRNMNMQLTFEGNAVVTTQPLTAYRNTDNLFGFENRNQQNPLLSPLNILFELKRAEESAWTSLYGPPVSGTVLSTNGSYSFRVRYNGFSITPNQTVYVDPRPSEVPEYTVSFAIDNSLERVTLAQGSTLTWNSETGSVSSLTAPLVGMSLGIEPLVITVSESCRVRLLDASAGRGGANVLYSGLIVVPVLGPGGPSAPETPAPTAGFTLTTNLLQGPIPQDAVVNLILTDFVGNETSIFITGLHSPSPASY